MMNKTEATLPGALENVWNGESYYFFKKRFVSTPEGLADHSGNAVNQCYFYFKLESVEQHSKNQIHSG